MTAAARPPRVKICGVRTPAEALLAAELGADFLGLNFFPPSPRYVELRTAMKIAAAVRESGLPAKLVGVFVNRPLIEVEEIEDAVGLDYAQFHGDETPEQLRAMSGKAIKVFRVRGRVDRGALAGVLASFGDVWGYLFDTRHGRLYGGTGESWDFSSLAAVCIDRPTFIAGGIGPDNVRAAVAASAPWGIDVCSGVEGEPGRKDPALLARLFDELAALRKETNHGQSPITT
jgi:phosphoribosylanthranilate isomerase